MGISLRTIWLLGDNERVKLKEYFEVFCSLPEEDSVKTLKTIIIYP